MTFSCCCSYWLCSGGFASQAQPTVLFGSYSKSSELVSEPEGLTQEEPSAGSVKQQMRELSRPHSDSQNCFLRCLRLLPEITEGHWWSPLFSCCRETGISCEVANPCLSAKPDWLRAIASVAITDAVTAIEAAATDAISLVILSV